MCRGDNLRYNFMVVPASGDPAYPLLPTPLSTPFVAIEYLPVNTSNLYAVAFDSMYVQAHSRGHACHGCTYAHLQSV